MIRFFCDGCDREAPGVRELEVVTPPTFLVRVRIPHPSKANTWIPVELCRRCRYTMYARIRSAVLPAFQRMLR